jgi:DNA-binding transcriptional LysR family regulator
MQVETPHGYEDLIQDRLDLALTFDYDLEPDDAPDAVERTFLADDPVSSPCPSPTR